MKNSDDILNSLEGITKAEPKPFLVTRVKASLLKQSSKWDKIIGIVSKPAIAFASIAFIVSINLFVFYEKDNNSKSTEASIVNDEDYVVNNYDLNTVYNYEKNIENEK